MKKYACPCGFIYDEAKGYPEKDIAPGSKFQDLPKDFACPVCGLNHKDWKEVEV